MIDEFQSPETNTMADFSIREAKSDDFDAIVAFWSKIDRHTGLSDRSAYLQQFHDFSPELFLVAESEGRVVGTVIGGWDGWRAQIARLATDASLRRSGIAKALVDEIEARLRRHGARRIYALVDRRSGPAVPFWESAGYAGNENILQYSRNLEDS